MILKKAEAMHYPRSNSDARRLRTASLLLLGNRLLILSAIALLLVSLFANDQLLLIVGSTLVFVCFALIVIQWIAASRVGCPLCRIPVLAPLGRAKHREARRLLGTYQFRVALSILFAERFRCPYCNESTAMDVRERLRSSRHRESATPQSSRFR